MAITTENDNQSLNNINSPLDVVAKDFLNDNQEDVLEVIDIHKKIACSDNEQSKKKYYIYGIHRRRLSLNEII